ncbi:Cation/H(+) antiporter 24 [Raphanus sativus]|nr:Cation/H(+) antiporter 24 [Raphanus sativus]
MNVSEADVLTRCKAPLGLYQENRDECVTLHAYTAHAPKRLMYQDICELALTKKTAFILLPYQKERLDDAAPTELRSSGMFVRERGCLGAHAMLVCIYYDKGRLRNAVFRFLAFNHEGEDEKEKKLDDGVVTWFWVKNEGKDRVSYKEVVVKNGAETLAAIQAMNVNDYDLWITGKREGINPKILEGLSEWSENHQLGVIGETVAGSIFASDGSVLVVQQQVRNRKGGDAFLNGKFDYKSLVSSWSCYR